MLRVCRQRRASSASCAGLQSRQLDADTGSAGGDQAVVADQPAGKLVKIGAKVVRQSLVPKSCAKVLRQSLAPRPLRHLPDGRGRGAKATVPRDSAADHGTTATATTSAGVRRPRVMRSAARLSRRSRVHLGNVGVFPPVPFASFLRCASRWASVNLEGWNPARNP